MSKITVFTPTYNRANTLLRVFTSLDNQSFRDFEWIIIDDGSTDNTKEVIDDFIKNARFPIKYYYQNNSGKHVAINRAVEQCNSEFFVIADSDDSFRPNALQVFIDSWNDIPNDKKNDFKGIICKCYDAVTGKDIGDFPGKIVDANELDAGFKLKFRFEKWSFFRTEVLREFPFPEPQGRLKFFPETVVWQNMSRKYLTRYINVSLRAYYRDQENSLTSKNTLRYNENIYLWQHYINETMDYFIYNPKLFLKAYVGISRDSMLARKSYSEVMEMINSFSNRVITTIMFPMAVVLKIKYEKDNALLMKRQ